jgi:branched-chain amino acid transport system substrate-binding protein
MKRRLFTHRAVASIALPWIGTCARAATVVTVAQVVPLTGGPAAEVGKQVALGVETYFKSANSSGVYPGLEVRYLVEDDQFKPELTITAAKTLLASKPVALISFATSNTLALIQEKLPQDNNVPLFPTRSGSQTIREPVNPYVFHVRAGYKAELTKLVAQMADALGVRKFAALYQNDTYGQSGLEAVKDALVQRKLPLQASAAYDRASSDIQEALAALLKADAQVIVMVAGHAAASAFVKAYREAGGKARLVGTSDLDPAKLVATLGADSARGVGMSQVFPSLGNQATAVVREYQQLMGAAKQEAALTSLASFEGFLVAKTIAQGLKHASQTVSGKSLADALSRQARIDLGGYELSFKGARREGSLFTQVAIIDAAGRARY